MRSCCRHKAVTSEVDSVNQSSGRPISDATKNGLRSAVGDPLRPRAIIATPRRPGSRRLRSPSLGDFESVVLGVGHRRTVASVNVWCWPFVPPDIFESVAVGVGHKPHSVAAVRGASRDSGDNIPFRIEPESGKVGEDVDESLADESRDVLQQDPSGSHVSDDATDRWPEPTVVVHTKALARRRERLAREAGSDEIHSAAPRLAVEGPDVRPDRSVIQARLRHPLHENGCCIAIAFDVTHGSAPCQGSEGSLEPSVAGTQVEGT